LCWLAECECAHARYIALVGSSSLSDLVLGGRNVKNILEPKIRRSLAVQQRFKRWCLTLPVVQCTVFGLNFANSVFILDLRIFVCIPTLLFSRS
jgi:hypothetical protein